jgi:SAM-dependent methyltransferase
MDRMGGLSAETAGAPLPTPFEDPVRYDALFEDLDFDRSFYVGLARAAGGPVLEVACGTGRVLIPCLEAGADIEGLDLEPAMLERLRAKAAAKGLRPKVHLADMRRFSLARRFALAFIPFNGFVHCLTTTDQRACLAACRAHLTPGGRLVFNTFFPRVAGERPPDGVPILEHEAPDPATGGTVRIYDIRSHDWVAQVQHSVMEIQDLDPSGTVVASRRSATDMRWTHPPEMELLLAASGFARWTIAGGFAGEPVSAGSGLLVVTAWRDGA